VRLFHERYRIETFFVDEIHFLRGYTAHLKELSDFYRVKIWFTSSSALSLYTSAWDLSRRVVVSPLLPFSFREFLAFRGQPLMPSLPLEQVLTAPIDSEYLRSAFRFRDYLSGGLYPFTLEPGAQVEQFRSVLKKIIASDIPMCEPRLALDELADIERLMGFVCRSRIDGINYSSLSANLGITKYKAERYVDLLERSFLLRRALPAGTNVLREPKVFVELPYRLLYRSYEESVGELREDFFALAMSQHGASFQYAKSTRGAKTPDFLMTVDEHPVVIEVGGRTKGRSQFKGVDYEKKVVLYHDETGGRHEPGRRVPLHCLGFA
jgi:predicted AAA+ superfamily ATPase